MDREDAAHFVRLVRVGDVARAHVLAAVLESEGIEVRVHSEALGPYPVTVGELATTEIWVLRDRVDDASAILLDAEMADAVGGVDGDDGGRAILELRLVAAGLIAVLVLAVVLRLMRVF